MALMCIRDAPLFLEADWWILILINLAHWQHGLGVCEMSFLPHFLVVLRVLHCTICTPGTGISLMRSFHPFFCCTPCCRFHTWQSVRLGAVGVVTLSWSEFCALSNKLVWTGIPSSPVAALHRELLQEKTRQMANLYWLTPGNASESCLNTDSSAQFIHLVNIPFILSFLLPASRCFVLHQPSLETSQTVFTLQWYCCNIPYRTLHLVGHTHVLRNQKHFTSWNEVRAGATWGVRWYVLRCAARSHDFFF